MMHRAHGYKRVNHELTNLKGIVSAFDNALFLWHDATGNLMGILALHLDENDLFQKNVIVESKRIFKVGMHKSRTFKFRGLRVRQTKDGITKDQNLYVSSISTINLKKGRSLRKNDEPREDRIKKTDST